MHKGEIAASELLKAHGNSAAVLDLHKKAFHKMPLFIMAIIARPWLHCIFLRRNAVLRFLLRNIRPIILAAIGFVNQDSGSLDRQLFKCRLHHNAVVYLAARQHKDKRVSQAVYDCVDFGGSRPPRLTPIHCPPALSTSPFLPPHWLDVL